MRIDKPDSQMKGSIVVLGFLEESLTSIRDPSCISRSALFSDLPWIDFLCTNMNFTNDASLVSSFVK
jgi:hypothetical protein